MVPDVPVVVSRTTSPPTSVMDVRLRTVASRSKFGARLVVTASIEKFFQIDSHIGAATSGLVADARVLVDYARLVAQINKVTYSEKIGVDLLVKRICDYKQNYTQYGGVRPFGTALLVAGVDDLGTHLFETDPSGALVSYKAGSIGAGRNAVMELFEEKYKEGMARDDAILLGLEALQKASEGEKLDGKTIEVGVVEEGQAFRRLSEAEVSAYLSRLPTAA